MLGADGGPIPVLAPGAAASLIAVYVAVMLGGAILLFERQDLGE